MTRALLADLNAAIYRSEQQEWSFVAFRGRRLTQTFAEALLDRLSRRLARAP